MRPGEALPVLVRLGNVPVVRREREREGEEERGEREREGGERE